MAKYASEEIICCITGHPGAEYHHIYTQKARPDLKECVWNKIPIRHGVHAEWHNKGTSYMAAKFLHIRNWLICHGWQYDDFRKKWIHPNAQKMESEK